MEDVWILFMSTQILVVVPSLLRENDTLTSSRNPWKVIIPILLNEPTFAPEVFLQANKPQ